MRDIQVEHSDNAASESGKWLVNDKDFTFWMDSWLSSGLWLQGNMGVGKSTLTMRVITTLETKYRKLQRGALAYYYCDGKRRSQTTMTASGILKVILHQLLGTPSALKVFQDTLEVNPQVNRSALTTDNVMAMIKKIICRSHDPLEQTTIVIDGLDELSSIEQIRIMNHVADLLNTEQSLVKVFISSRPLDSVHRKTQNMMCWASIEVMSSSLHDLEFYVDTRIDERWKPDESHTTENLRLSLKSIIKERAAGK